ncbi:rhodanese-like domain-containing protein [candidate division KSB1 bacterium]|nr:rhodanese-like domain-containing protein [candidate division KSB1 bacterium]
MKKTKIPKVLKQALFLIILAMALGLPANWINPKGIPLGFTRPTAVSAADSLFTLPVGDQHQRLDKPLTINTDQVHTLQNAEKAILLDARSLTEYRSGHIPGAVNLPYEEIFEHEDIYNSLPYDKWLICYCEGPPCDLGELLAWELFNMGYTAVAIYTDGLNEWIKTQDVERVETEPAHEN